MRRATATTAAFTQQASRASPATMDAVVLTELGCHQRPQVLVAPVIENDGNF
jgi:hypothetical protein